MSTVVVASKMSNVVIYVFMVSISAYDVNRNAKEMRSALFVLQPKVLLGGPDTAGSISSNCPVVSMLATPPVETFNARDCLE